MYNYFLPETLIILPILNKNKNITSLQLFSVISFQICTDATTGFPPLIEAFGEQTGILLVLSKRCKILIPSNSLPNGDILTVFLPFFCNGLQGT